jgi:BASS family bile acid:Na+ symporter
LAQAINVLVVVTLVAMMLVTGFDVSPGALRDVAKRWRLVARTLLVNYLVFPVVALALLIFFHARPMPAAGFLVLAVCPGAPFGPQITALSRGNVTVSVGLMGILAASSVFLAPLLLKVLLPRVAGESGIHIAFGQIVATLLVTQLIPLAVGLAVRWGAPTLAAKLTPPFTLFTRVVSLVTVVLLVVANRTTLGEITGRALVGMLAVWLSSMVFGWLAGDSHDHSRSAVAQTTALRNVGVAMVIATKSFPGTAAAPAVIAYAAVSIAACALVALAWGRGRTPATLEPVEE